ncbi:MAG: InlB B-repeat-containing protein [Aquiluna sp.]|nr:InlB B-repeat-containing protein [Aquiluna sp.]MCF8545487.1 InlB B-repeat-containing protein [Aquiluna sp.]
MAKHRKSSGSSFFKKAIAGSSLLTLAAAPSLFFVSPSFAATHCDLLNNEAVGIFAESLAESICQVTFKQDVESWTLPATVNKLSVVGVGAGGGALSVAGVGNSGSGGQFSTTDTVDLSASRVFNIELGEKGANATAGSAAGDGTNTVLKNIVSGAPTTTLLMAYGGKGGTTVSGSLGTYARTKSVANATFSYYTTGQLGDSSSVVGAGTSSDGFSSVGGLGIAINSEIGNDFEPNDYLDSTVWAADSQILGSGVSLLNFSFGNGGAIDSAPVDANELSGHGASVSADGALVRSAGNGVLIMRFGLTSTAVSFDANGGTGSIAIQEASTETSLNANSFTRSGYRFIGWNTERDGSGTDYADGAIFSFATSEALYAQWEDLGLPRPVSTVSYEGPIGIRQSSPTNCVGDLTTVSGSRLGTIQKIYVDGADIPFTLESDSKINFKVPNLQAGSYQIKYWVPVNGVNLTGKITIGSCIVAPVETLTEIGSGEVNPFRIAKRFTGYRGETGAIANSDREAITAFIAANPGLTHITCVGSTSGKPASATDQSLAMARAENACSVVEDLAPGVQTRMVASTGRGVGKFFRAVTLFGKGLREN